jgi:archaellum component FlaC
MPTTEVERIEKLEEEMLLMKIDLAVAKSDISTIKGKLDKIDMNVSKLVWLVVGAVLLAIINVVLNGGGQ